MNQRRAAHVVSRVGGQLVELGQAAGGALGVPFVKQARDQGTPGQHAVGARTLSSSRGEHLEQLTRDGPGEPVRSAQCCVEVGRRWLTGVRRRDAPHGAADVHRQCAVEHGVHEPVPQRIVVRGRAVVCGGDCVAQSPVGSGAIGAIHDDYARYVDILTAWGAPHGLSASEVEERIFGLIPPRRRRTPRPRTPQ